jgi:riboflavin synthase
MFTGLIEEIGTIKRIERNSGSCKISVQAKKILEDLKIDDSVAINGVCQTVIAVQNDVFTVTAVEETLSKTTLSALKNGSLVNLERALRPIDRMGGHIVQGHVDCVGVITNIQHLATAVLIWVTYPKEFSKYVVRTGSICIDGVSLTTAKVENNRFMVSIIPHTWETTTLKLNRVGDKVNLEFDIIGKYIEKLINIQNESKSKGVLDDFLTQPEF